MKQIDTFIIALAIITVCIIGCNSGNNDSGVGIEYSSPKQTDSAKQADADYIDKYHSIQRDKNGMTIYTVDGHEYIKFNGENVIHNQACPNPKHIQ